MSSETSDDAPHPASQVHLARARDHGYICRSFFLAQAIQIGGMMLVIGLGYQPMIRGFADLTRQLWSNAAEFETNSAAVQIWQVAWGVATPTVAILTGLFLVACLSHLVQTGFTWKAHAGEWDLLSGPRTALRQLFSKMRLFPLFLAWALIIAASWMFLSNGTIWQIGWQNLWMSDRGGIPQQWWGFIWRLLLPLVVALFAFGLLDYAWRRWCYVASLSLTDQQMRDEQKEDENRALRRLRDRRTR